MFLLVHPILYCVFGHLVNVFFYLLVLSRVDSIVIFLSDSKSGL